MIRRLNHRSVIDRRKWNAIQTHVGSSDGSAEIRMTHKRRQINSVSYKKLINNLVWFHLGDDAAFFLRCAVIAAKNTT